MATDPRRERASLLGGGGENDSDSDLEEISPSRSGGGSGGRGSASADKVKLVKGQVDEVVGIMRNNIAKTIERGDRLDVLVDKTDELAQSSDLFNSRAKALRRQMWWNNMKIRLMIILIIGCFLAIIITSIVLGLKN